MKKINNTHEVTGSGKIIYTDFRGRGLVTYDSLHTFKTWEYLGAGSWVAKKTVMVDTALSDIDAREFASNIK